MPNVTNRLVVLSPTAVLTALLTADLVGQRSRSDEEAVRRFLRQGRARGR
jgi:branched-subunit amino acid transport protein